MNGFQVLVSSAEAVRRLIWHCLWWALCRKAFLFFKQKIVLGPVLHGPAPYVTFYIWAKQRESLMTTAEWAVLGKKKKKKQLLKSSLVPQAPCWESPGILWGHGKPSTGSWAWGRYVPQDKLWNKCPSKQGGSGLGPLHVREERGYAGCSIWGQAKAPAVFPWPVSGAPCWTLL